MVEDSSVGGAELGVTSSAGVREAPKPLKYYPYPPPLANYENVLADPNLFMSTLEKLHLAMGTKFMIPIIGGKELDLHRLFIEVTSRGGIGQVIRERRWKEITAVFNFPSTATNASFILRKYYVSLLHHYEQIYFFKATGWTPPSDDPLPNPSTTPISSQGLVEPVRPSSGHAAAPHKRSKVGFPVAGVIDGKFEHGYLITVSVGTENLKGVLYHTSEQPTQNVPPHTGTEISPKGPRRRRRRRSEMKKRDPARPKPNRSGYNFFFAEQHARLKPLHPGKDREISKMIGELWNKITESEKAVYQEKGMKDKERYRSEMKEYWEKLRTGQIISDAVPIQQRVATPEVVIAEEDEKFEAEEVERSSTGETDSDDDKTPDKDSEMEMSEGGGGNGVESSKVAEVHGAEGDQDQDGDDSDDVHGSRLGNVGDSGRNQSG